MVRALPFVAVRQQQNQRRRQSPLGAARGEELVEHHLRAVDEVAVLAFPHDEAARLLDVVAEFEADGRVLGERAVVNLERRPARRAARPSGVCSAPVTASCSTAWRWLNVPRSTSSPVRRIGRPSSRIDANASSSAVAQSTVRSSGVLEHRQPPLARAFELAVHREAVGYAHQIAIERAQPIDRHRGLRPPRGAARRNLGQWRHVVLLRLERRVGLLEARHVPLDHRVRRLGIDRAVRGQLRRIDLAHRRMAADDLVDLRLRERRLVAFVVAVAAIADEIDQEVELEPLPIGPGQPGRFDAGHRIVGVDVDDGNLEAAGEAARVAGAVRLPSAPR